MFGAGKVMLGIPFDPTARFLGYGASSHVTTTSVCSIPAPVGVVVGDLIVAFGCANGNETWTATGWTEVRDQGVNPNLFAMYRLHDGSASYSFTLSGAARSLVGHILAFRSQSYDLVGTIATSSNANIVMPSITKTGAGFLLAAAASVGTSAATHSTPIGMTVTATTKNVNTTLTTFWQAVATGATGSRTSNNSAGTNAGVLLGIKN